MRRHRGARRDRDGALGRLILGSYLILIGALVFAANVGVDVPHGVWSYWPFLLMAGGAAKLFFGRGRALGEGFWLLLAGLYCWVSVWNLWGLTWGTAWPIFLVAAGFSMVLEPWLARRDAAGSAPETAASDSEVDRAC
jgi:hypothetical protein